MNDESIHIHGDEKWPWQVQKTFTRQDYSNIEF